MVWLPMFGIFNVRTDADACDVCFFLKNFFYILHCPLAENRVALSVLYCVQYFRESKLWYGCPCLGFLTCVQMLMHAIAHGGCTDTVRESALKVDSGRRSLCRTWDSNPRQYCARLFSRTLYQQNYSPPFVSF